MNSKIYKITNTITGESYIGQTVRSVEERFYQHKQGTRQAKYKMSKLQKAMDEYGKRNFIVELIEDSIDDISVLREREEYYINLYNPEYNSSKGGETPLGAPSSSNRPGRKMLYHKELDEISVGRMTRTEYDLFMSVLYCFTTSSASKLEISFYEIKEILGNLLMSNSLVTEIGESLKIKLDSCDLFNTWIVDYKNQFLIVEVNPVYLPLIHPESRKGTIILDMNEFIQLKDPYSKTLFKLLSRKKRTKKLKISSNELKSYLNIPKSYDTRRFNEKILHPSVDLLNDFFEDLKVNKIKRGRIILYYEFTFTATK